MKVQYQILGKYLRQKRTEASLKQVEVARILGFKPQYIANWERGASRPPYFICYRLIKILKAPQKEFLNKLLEQEELIIKKSLELSKRNPEISLK